MKRERRTLRIICVRRIINSTRGGGREVRSESGF
jgi:hypothetical protein